MKPFCFSLSGIYESEGYAWEQAGKIWDLRELRGTDGYLDPGTEQFLEAELGANCCWDLKKKICF